MKKDISMKGVPFRTNTKITWCPGCPDHMILESLRRAFVSLEKQGFKKENFVNVSGIGCHGKIFDYLNTSSFYGLHGRPIPAAIGIKFGNPNFKVVVSAGDGDTYSEGMEHFIHACRFNPDITLLVHDNQSFSLTTGQPSPTSQLTFKSKSQPLGVVSSPINPLMIALSAGASFVARCNARDLDHTQEIIEKAIKHKGFAYVEIIQDCIIFNVEINNRDYMMYKIPEKDRSLKDAMQLAQEYDYNLGKGKIPLGIFYKKEKKTLEENWPQLQDLKKKGIGWSDLKR
ncbi:MAG: thiamine pyrophosphate-dependent enzyme [Nanoarchaeota archaeon]